MKKLIGIVSVAIIFAGCATAHKISRVQIGMSKNDVIGVMGNPASTSAKGDTEYLNYSLSDTADQAFYGITMPYFVRLVNGIVDAYGRLGDFDSTKDPTVKVKTEEDIKMQSTKSATEGDLYTELRKLKELKEEGLITQEEFERKRKEIVNKH